MIKPIGPINSIAKPVTEKVSSLIDKTAARERITNLIRDFEEQYKANPKNQSLFKHINDLKEALKKYQ